MKFCSFSRGKTQIFSGGGSAPTPRWGLQPPGPQVVDVSGDEWGEGRGGGRTCGPGEPKARGPGVWGRRFQRGVGRTGVRGRPPEKILRFFSLWFVLWFLWFGLLFGLLFGAKHNQSTNKIINKSASKAQARLFLRRSVPLGPQKKSPKNFR